MWLLWATLSGKLYFCISSVISLTTQPSQQPYDGYPILFPPLAAAGVSICGKCAPCIWMSFYKRVHISRLQIGHIASNHDWYLDEAESSSMNVVVCGSVYLCPCVHTYRCAGVGACVLKVFCYSSEISSVAWEIMWPLIRNHGSCKTLGKFFTLSCSLLLWLKKKKKKKGPEPNGPWDSFYHEYSMIQWICV